MNESNDNIMKTSDAERIEQLLADVAQLESELALERQQLASAQQQLSAMSQQLASLMNAGTEPMMPIGEHFFDVSKIAALTWNRSIPEVPTICVDGTVVWQPRDSRPSLLSAAEVNQQERDALPARLEAWEAECQEAMETILAAINLAKEEIKKRRRRK